MLRNGSKGAIRTLNMAIIPRRGVESIVLFANNALATCKSSFELWCEKSKTEIQHISTNDEIRSFKRHLHT